MKTLVFLTAFGLATSAWGSQTVSNERDYDISIYKLQGSNCTKKADVNAFFGWIDADSERERPNVIVVQYKRNLNILDEGDTEPLPRRRYCGIYVKMKFKSGKSFRIKKRYFVGYARVPKESIITLRDKIKVFSGGESRNQYLRSILGEEFRGYLQENTRMSYRNWFRSTCEGRTDANIKLKIVPRGEREDRKVRLNGIAATRGNFEMVYEIEWDRC